MTKLDFIDTISDLRCLYPGWYRASGIALMLFYWTNPVLMGELQTVEMATLPFTDASGQASIPVEAMSEHMSKAMQATISWLFPPRPLLLLYALAPLLLPIRANQE